LKWLPNEYSYSYIEEAGESKWLAKGFATSGKKAQIVSLNDLSNQLNAYNIKAPTKFPTVTWIDDLNFSFKEENKLFTYSVDGSDLNLRATFPDETEDVTLSEDKSQAAFTHENNLFIVLNEKENKQITTDGKYGVTNGKSVSRNEFGIKGGIFWSPKSNYLAFYHENLSHVTDYPILDITTTPAEVENIKYPMAGNITPVVSIGIYNLLNKELVWLKIDGPKDQYLTNVTWGPNEKYLYVGHLNRDQNHLQLVKYDAATGKKVKVLFEEKDEQYVEPQKQLQFLTNDPNKFIWFSQRDGWNHLYLYNSNGVMIKQLTKGKWVVTDYLGFDKKGEDFYVVGTMDSPMERNLYKVNLQDGKFVKKLTKNIGTHKILEHSSMRYFIDIFSSTTTPKEISILTERGDIYGKIHNSKNPIKDYAIGK
ncbi:MAG: DPP IV N-terminal domain-containing protein, partial [Melioribacteraceae bacterium]|nr:DPP IV N-terminal domain-containing protein [Melioribacteraceae bacterium]